MTTAPPLIGIVAEYSDVDIHSLRYPHHIAADYYIKAVVAAGGLPVVMPLLEPELAAAFVDRVDGVLLSGGVDMDPASYGHELDAATKTPQRFRDEFERSLVATLVERNTPTLGICRGLQTINVALGGNLRQDLPEHPRVLEWDAMVHAVDIVPDSRLARIVGGVSIETNSLHHQGIGTVADGVRVDGTAHGLVEAIEIDDADRILAVQWHPEVLIEYDAHRALFRDLVTNATS
jgi:putative glutamine amidotransferase